MAATGHRKQGHSQLHAPLPKPDSVTSFYFEDPMLPESNAGMRKESLCRSSCMKLRKRVPTLALLSSPHEAPSSAFWERRTLYTPAAEYRGLHQSTGAYIVGHRDSAFT